MVYSTNSFLSFKRFFVKEIQMLHDSDIDPEAWSRSRSVCPEVDHELRVLKVTGNLKNEMLLIGLQRIM